jgi:hypothetical protein
MVTREQLFKFVTPNVYQATDERQSIAYEPRLASSESLQKIVFRLGGGPALDVPTPDPGRDAAPAQQGDPVRVAVANGPEASFSAIEKGRAPFVRSARLEAELVWDVADSTALSRGDLVMSKVDGSLLGAIIDRTWAIREIQKLSRSRVLDVRMREQGKSYTIGDHPELLVSGIRGSYLTIVNIAADGTLQMLFPFYSSDNPHILGETWTYGPIVDAPFGSDHVIAVTTSGPATDLIAWLTSHNIKRDAVELPAVIARTIAADPPARVGTIGLYTVAAH